MTQPRRTTGDRLLPILTTYGAFAGMFAAACWVYVRGPRDTAIPGAVPGVWTSFGNVESSPSLFPAILVGLLLGALALHLLARALRYQGFLIVREANSPAINLVFLFGSLGLLTGFAAYGNLALNPPYREWIYEQDQPLIISADPIWISIPGSFLIGSLLIGAILSVRWRLIRQIDQ